MTFSLKTPTDQEFQQICNYIHEFELDDRLLLKDQFTVALRDGELVGFGRLRSHADCIELCSLGVVTQHRKQGIGKAIVTELIRNAPSNLYLVCIIPEYFSSFGFTVVDKYPLPIQDKLDYCTHELIVPEVYVVMQLQK